VRAHTEVCDMRVRTNTYCLGWSWLLVLPLALLPGPAASQTSGQASSKNPVSDATEAARLRAFLDARYKASDVRYSFHTQAGQTIDCVDFFAEPGVKALAARGQPLTSIPAPPPVPDAFKNRTKTAGPRTEENLSFHGQPDVNGNPEQCPEGSVPEVRITAEDIARAGGLDAYRRIRKRPPPHVQKDNPGPTCAYAQSHEYPTYSHVVGTLVSDTPGIAYGSTVMSIYGPNVPSVAGDHSLSQLWLYSGSNTSVDGPPCTSDCVQSVEIGWDVDNVINSGDQNTPHLFLFSTNNGYGDGCYNNIPNLPGACVPWVPLPGAAFALNQALSYNPAGDTPPLELTATVLLVGGGYWITLQIGSTSSYIGYFPQSDFSAPMETFQVGGEVEDQTETFLDLAMGSGNYPDSGYGWAAYHHDFAAAWIDGVMQWSDGAAMCAARPADYSYLTTGGLSTWDQYFYFGGNPILVRRRRAH
jgi:hypothetical protein